MKKILVADDTKNIRNLVTTCLELRHFEVTTATNGREAFETIIGGQFDLVFLDVKMPELSGTEVLRRIRELGHDMPVVMMTAYGTVKNAVDCTKLGAVSYLQKPFTADRLNEIVDQLNTVEHVDETIAILLEKSMKQLEEKKYSEAYAILKKCLAMDPNDKDVYWCLGRLYEKRNESDRARQFYSISELLDTTSLQKS